ncbi:MAG: hypothetical protein KAJ07_04690 [Planctomycetes bacterium]|nr:hypothetical protein [Planctomycetota bacterium]
MKRCPKCRSSDIRKLPEHPRLKISHHFCNDCEERTPTHRLLDLPDQRTITEFSVDFKWFDLWVGAFIDVPSRALYIILIPTIVFKWQKKEVYICEFCNSDMHQAAYNTGDGWLLFYECDDEQCDHTHDLEDYWPWGDERVSGDDLEKRGWKVV